MDYTQNLHLPQWEETDRIHHDDFNDAFAAIDAMPRIATGTYTGTGEYGSAHSNTLTFDFTPKFLFIRVLEMSLYQGLSFFAPHSNGRVDRMGTAGSSDHIIPVTWNGNSISWYSAKSETFQMNEANTVYGYFAIG